MMMMEPFVLDLGRMFGLTERHRMLVTDVLKMLVSILVVELLTLQAQGRDLVLSEAFMTRAAYQTLGFAAYHLLFSNLIHIRLA
jgi:hypothetical protein